MLFRKDMDPRCAYCQRGQQINEREVACVKRASWRWSTTAGHSNTTP